MNKVFTINLGGYPFTIDEDAYNYLDKYLKAIHRHFKKSEGYEEITSDIETRLAELFQESMGTRPIVTMKDVNHSVTIMGKPEDFGVEEELLEDDEPNKTKQQHKKHSFRPGKRLFRDPDEEVIAGVCSGIAAYLGITDPLWVRLLFIVLAISSAGFWFIVYGVLWAVLPQATTAGDRLAMKGEPINISNIGRIVQEEIENLSDKISDYGEEFKSKKKILKRKVRDKSFRKGFIH